jgi:hypothetical protein
MNLRFLNRDQPADPAVTSEEREFCAEIEPPGSGKGDVITPEKPKTVGYSLTFEEPEILILLSLVIR